MSLRTTALVLALAAAPFTGAPAATALPVTELAQKTHFHGIAVDAADPSRVYLASHHGLYVVDGAGLATRVSADGNDYMGFTPHPADPGVLYASGHPVGGGNMGFLASTDGGRTWQQLSPGVGGPVDFHQMDVSRADPQRVYGAFKGLQVSRDGGRSFALEAPLPDGLIDLAASAVDTERLYAATKGGLLVSEDGGQSWRAAHMRRSPASMVQTGVDGDLYAFVLGAGLLRTKEPALGWVAVNNGFGDGYLLHLAVDPSDPARLFAITGDGAVLASTDAGANWRPLGH